MIQDKTIKEIKRTLVEFDKLELSNISFEEIIVKVRTFFVGTIKNTLKIGGPNYRNEDGYGIFRVREVKENLFDDVSDYWAPPQELVKSYGRCNKINESILYCSNHFATCFVECRAQSNSYWTLIEYEFAQKLTFISLGFKDDKIYKTATNYLSFPDPLMKLSSMERKKQEIVAKYLRRRFKQKVINNPDAYKITTAFCDFFRNCDQLKNNDFGIIYPSIAAREKGINFAISDTTSKKYLKIKSLKFMKITKMDLGEGRMDYSLIAEGQIINDQVEWKRIDRVLTPI